MKKQFKGRRSLIASFVASALATAAAGPGMVWAQESGATLEGKADANAEVTVKNVDTGLTRKTKAGSDGTYTIVGLPAGTYNVDAGPGTEQTVTLSVASTETLDLGKLQTVTVSGTRLVETKTSEIGQIISLGVCAWLIRDLLRTPGDGFEWKPWLSRVVALTLGIGTLQLMTNTDVVYVQSIFPADKTPLYMPAAMIGLALVTFTGPLSSVMFPKVVRSAALTRDTRALQHALGATALLGGGAALACTLLPKLPLQIIYFGNPAYWVAWPLVPWFAWSLLPLILANVLIGNLLARERDNVE